MYIHLFETIHLAGVQWKIAGKNREPQHTKSAPQTKTNKKSSQKNTLIELRHFLFNANTWNVQGIYSFYSLPKFT